jgi:hypothetical protein
MDFEQKYSPLLAVFTGRGKDRRKPTSQRSGARSVPRANGSGRPKNRAIVIARIQGCGWWLMGAFWGTLFQVAVAPVQWAMAKGHTTARRSPTR